MYSSTSAIESLRMEESLHRELHIEQSGLQTEVLDTTSSFELITDPGLIYEKSPTTQEICNVVPQSLHV